MDKAQKFEYSQGIETFLEENQVYDLFEGLLKNLLLHKPEKPLEYLIDQLSQKKPVTRVFLMGPPGSQKQENALFLAEQFGWSCITTGDELLREKDKHTETGKKIHEAQSNFQYVDDKIVIDLITKKIMELEEKKQSWIIQGFPRTKAQALALQKLGIIPDKIIQLQQNEEVSKSRIKEKLLEIKDSLYGPELKQLVDQCLQEYELNMRGVNNAFNQFVFHLDINGRLQSLVANDLYKMLDVRFRSNEPRRPPRVVVVGPPGSGKTTQCYKISEFFGLVNVSVNQLVRHHLSTNPEDKDEIVAKMNKGEPLPDSLLNNLVASRLKQADCRINGWILDDYGYSPEQIQNFKSLRIKPSVVLAMDQSEETSISRIKHRRIDPKTGQFYNLRLDAPKDEAVHKRLVYQNMDDPNCVAGRFTFWKSCVAHIENSFGTQYKAIPAERCVEHVFESIADVVQNPPRTEPAPPKE